MVDASSLAAVALRLIDENGRSVTLTRRDFASGADPLTTAQSDAATVTTKAVFTTDMRPREDETSLKRDRFVAWVPALTVDVRAYDLLLDGDVDYLIVDVESFKPGSTEIVHRLELQR